MEEVEATLLEGGISWLAETILENLAETDKLGAWIRQVGLADDTKKLRSEIERVEAVVADVKGRAIENRSLARSLGRLRELLYDADDAVDELDYFRLHQQVQGDACQGAPGSVDGHGGGAEQTERPLGNAGEGEASGSAGTRRSGVWQHFEIVEEKNGKPAKAKCIDCHTVVKCGSDNGTSVLHNHRNSGKCKRKRGGATDQPPNLPSASEGVVINGNSAATGNSVGRKRMRTEGASADHVAANSHPWNKTEISNRIKQMTHLLQEAMNEVLQLRGLDYFASSNIHQSTTSDQLLGTSGLLQRKMYGRVEEKNSIIKLMTEAEANSITVVPIVGIGGIGKTGLAQFVYNHPTVESLFQQKIWVWVSNNFDKVRITGDMLDFVGQEKHERSCSFPKLQEILMNRMKSKRFLLILDDVWDSMNNYRLNKLLAPFKANNAKGNVILVTTRIWSVAKRIGTVEPIKFGALDKEDSWLLFKSCAFGDQNHEPTGVLSTIGQKLIDKLEGNPLAVETAGELLSEHHTVDHWNNILKNEDWKSLQLSGGIMPSLKRSYDQLAYRLQQCFLYCSIFPRSYQFCGQDLVRIWISLGFVRCRHSNKRLEEIGEGYLTLLVNSGLFQQVQREESSPESQPCYVMCGLMHDFARLISRTDFATIDGKQCTEILPTIRHLSILTDSAFCKDQDGNIVRNKRFEERLQTLATYSNKLRTLVLIGQYDCFFFQSLVRVFQKAQNLRVMHIDAEYAGFNSFLCEKVNHIHLRYIKLRAVEEDGALPQVLSRFYHLQVLDMGSDANPTIFNGIHNLVSLRHLVAQKGVCSYITSIGKMTSLQELHDFRVQKSSGFEISQLLSMNELVNLVVSRLKRVRSQQEACGASLKDKQHLERLDLSWRDANDGYYSDMSNENEHDSDMGSESESDSDSSSENENDSDMMFEASMDIETEGERLPMIDIDGSQRLEHFRDMASEVLEGLEPHHGLKYLRISGYNGSTSPTWLPSSLTCLQTLHLEKCGKWQILPLERLGLLLKLVLIKMRNATELSIPSLEELVLIALPSLNTCSCTSIRNLNSSLKVLKIKNCPVLKVFPLFEICQKFEIERTSSWLPHLSKLTIYNCPLSCVHSSLPPSSIVSKLLIGKVSTLPTVRGSSSGTLIIGLHPDEVDDDDGLEDSDQLKTLDDKVLLFHNLRFLTSLAIYGCRNLATISIESLRQLVCLKSLELYGCPKLFSSDVPPELTCEYMSGANHSALPSLECLDIEDCGITGKWLSLMLQHVQALQELSLKDCQQITRLSIGEEENSQPNLMSAMEDPSLGYPDRDKLLRLPLNLISSLKKVSITCCDDLTFDGSKVDFAGFTSLEELVISACPKLLSFLAHNDGNDEQSNGRWFLPLSLGGLEIGYVDSLKTLQPCFPENLTSLKKLKVWENQSLTSLQLHSCTALQELIIQSCESLNSLEGLQWLGNLRLLQAHRCLSGYGEYGRCTLPQSLEELYIHEYSQETLQPCFSGNLTLLRKLHAHRCLSGHGEDGRCILPQSLEELFISEYSQETLQPCFSGNLTHLKKLQVKGNSSLVSLQLHSCTSLEELIIQSCESLSSLDGLQLLGNLRLLQAHRCLSGHGEDGRCILPQSLEELFISEYSLETLQPCFQMNLSCLKKIEVLDTASLKSLQLQSSTALEHLRIKWCASLATLEGLQFLHALKHLEVFRCPGLPPYLGSLSGQGYELCLRLERLDIDDPSILTTSFCKHLTSLQRLELNYCGSEVARLTDEQERALQLLLSLQELRFGSFYNLIDLPAGLHSLPSLKRLEIWWCRSIARLPEMGLPPSLEELDILGCSKELVQQCRTLASKLKVSITCCDDLTFYGSKEDFARFTSLEELVISQCPKLISSWVHTDGNDEQANGRLFLPLSLGELEIADDDCLKTLRPCFPGNPTRLKKLEVWRNQSLTSLQLHSCTSLQVLIIQSCKSLNSLEGLQSLGNLRLLRAERCLIGYGEYGRCILQQSLEELYISEYSQETLQPCFEMNFTCLKKLEVSGTASLKYLELQSCTALEHLKIESCASLATLQGLQFLHALRHLEVFRCPILPPYLGSLSGQGDELCPRLERLKIDDPSILTTSFCKHLTSLQRLELNHCGSEVARLTDEQERALQLLTSLKKLQFGSCYNLMDLPAGLHSLPSLKRLEIERCLFIARLPVKGLPPSLEELDISYCSKELAQQCRTLASKLKVKIDWRYVN
uniref:BED-type domain-containing protein n=1 Tax=Oryza nivara TaxID=4536 RepID=A0A0E0H659_ORYNI